MANNRFVWDGLQQLFAELRALPEHLRDEGGGIVHEKAQDALNEIEAAYPERTGNLKDGLDLRTQSSSTFGVSYVVRNRSPHAWLFDNGSQARHTAIGANRGAMPPRPTFVPSVIRHRGAMYEALKDLLRRAGLEVSGDA